MTELARRGDLPDRRRRRSGRIMDVNEASADLGWQRGWVANGNPVPRHLGIPDCDGADGTMADIGMPVGLTFAVSFSRRHRVADVGRIVRRRATLHRAAGTPRLAEETAIDTPPRMPAESAPAIGPMAFPERWVFAGGHRAVKRRC